MRGGVVGRGTKTAVAKLTKAPSLLSEVVAGADVVGKSLSSREEKRYWGSLVMMTQLCKLRISQNRPIYLNQVCVARLRIEDIAFTAKMAGHRHNHLFSN